MQNNCVCMFAGKSFTANAKTQTIKFYSTKQKRVTDFRELLWIT